MCISKCVGLCLVLCLWVSVCQSVSLSVYISEFVSECVCLSLSVCVPLEFCLSNCVWGFVCVCLICLCGERVCFSVPLSVYHSCVFEVCFCLCKKMYRFSSLSNISVLLAHGVFWCQLCRSVGPTDASCNNTVIHQELIANIGSTCY